VNPTTGGQDLFDDGPAVDASVGSTREVPERGIAQRSPPPAVAPPPRRTRPARRKARRSRAIVRAPRGARGGGAVGFWTVNKVSLAAALLVMAFGWSLMAVFYANARDDWRTFNLVGRVAGQELGDFVEATKHDRHSLFDFLLNALGQVPNAPAVLHWAVRNVPWMIVAVVFLEVLVAWYWTASRRLEREWSEIDEPV
jgi:hypothetical protein